MEQSILTSTKKALGITDTYTAFDLDITSGINAAFSVLNQIGIGPPEGFAIEDAEAVWDDLDLPLNQLSMVKTYVYLKTKLVFDPPTTSFLLDAVKQQIEEHEGRLSIAREDLIPIPDPAIVAEEVVYIPLPSYMEGGY